MTIRMVMTLCPSGWSEVMAIHADGQQLEFLEGPDGQKNTICSDHPDGQNVMIIRMVTSHDHPDGQQLEFLEGLDGQELECS